MVWVGGGLRGGEARRWVAGLAGVARGIGSVHGEERGYEAEVRIVVNQSWSSGKKKGEDGGEERVLRC